MQVNNEPLLSVEYDDTDTSETVFSRGRDRLLTVVVVVVVACR